MTTSDELPAVSLQGLRVLVIDNNPDLRTQTVDLLRCWGCCPVAPEGSGDILVGRAKEEAARSCCQLALVDMRLHDDNNANDISGLKLIADLRPTLSIVMSSFGTVHTTKAAFRQYDAIDFVPKEDGPAALELALKQAVVSQAIGARHISIDWSEDLDSAILSQQLFKGRSNVPNDEADDVIGRLFHDSRRVVLTTISDLEGFADAAFSSNEPKTLRRESQVFRVQVDGQPALMVVKIGKREKIAREVINYRTYVENGLKGLFRPEMRGDLELWNIGAVSYRFVGNADLGTSEGSHSFTHFYRTTKDPEQILIPLRHFFEQSNWGNWYRIGVASLGKPLFAAYDEILHNKLSRHFPEWANYDRTMEFVGIAKVLPDPRRWLNDHYRRSADVLDARQAITHGDLHGDNLFTSADHAWPIDFERTGPGPILRDFVEIIQDILTRIAQFTLQDQPVVYDLAIALCEPSTPDQPMRLTERILAHPEAYKAFHVVQALQKLAAEIGRYADRRELLWGLLFNNLFVLSRIQDYTSGVRYQHTLLMASVICSRLNKWSATAPWPPAG